ncbi:MULTISPECIES: HAD family hydrolase [Acinetobacter]|uniref:HAD family hydrolase n=1 Tax=Acinetobacter TaxID=469 RepID=UPI00019AE2C3|nr:MULTISPECIES: HAD-IB family hydrolase [Acinetobacter]EEH67450.1 HAD hydrolase, family IB [Acinetobacter sp. ATCC 27244]NAS08972.1 HAD-IB family hydrolase [Acinetobacter haemolyticus]SUU21364.1 phosphoserine phosphatase [Acinetobacter haemolyticus]
MSKVAAFFDVDETLINMKSMFNFYEYWCVSQNLEDQLHLYLNQFKQDTTNGKSREFLNKQYYKEFNQVEYSRLLLIGQQWFEQLKTSDLFIKNTIARLNQHLKDGETPVFVSGSMYPILAPIASYLHVDEILSAPLLIDHEGFCTGEIGTPQTIGLGKKAAALAYCKRNAIDPADCYAYGDDTSDIPMLELTGNPVCVGHNQQLLDYGNSKGWKHISFN